MALDDEAQLNAEAHGKDGSDSFSHDE